MRRGEVWWASRPSPTGSGPGFRRPVVVQSNDFNHSAIATVIVAVITSNLTARRGSWQHPIIPSPVQIETRFSNQP
jgi:mRNA-degrading endonuclease toxin of MazEF toxin-antitoxin module